IRRNRFRVGLGHPGEFSTRRVLPVRRVPTARLLLSASRVRLREVPRSIPVAASFPAAASLRPARSAKNAFTLSDSVQNRPGTQGVIAGRLPLVFRLRTALLSRLVRGPC